MITMSPDQYMCKQTGFLCNIWSGIFIHIAINEGYLDSPEKSGQEQIMESNKLCE